MIGKLVITTAMTTKASAWKKKLEKLLVVSLIRLNFRSSVEVGSMAY